MRPQPMPAETCPDCGHPEDGEHDEECIIAEHAAMEAGDEIANALHDPDECELCLIQNDVRAKCQCRCGLCREYMIIEATALDARREPKIRERGSIIDEGGEIPPDQADWMLNRGRGCVFFHRDAEGKGICEIYETRPLCCRLFDCDHDGRAREYREEFSRRIHVSLPIVDLPDE